MILPTLCTHQVPHLFLLSFINIFYFVLFSQDCHKDVLFMTIMYVYKLTFG